MTVFYNTEDVKKIERYDLQLIAKWEHTKLSGHFMGRAIPTIDSFLAWYALTTYRTNAFLP
jgi:hypothetical protein